MFFNLREKGELLIAVILSLNLRLISMNKRRTRENYHLIEEKEICIHLKNTDSLNFVKVVDIELTYRWYKLVINK